MGKEQRVTSWWGDISQAMDVSRTELAGCWTVMVTMRGQGRRPSFPQSSFPNPEQTMWESASLTQVSQHLLILTGHQRHRPSEELSLPRRDRAGCSMGSWPSSSQILLLWTCCDTSALWGHLSLTGSWGLNSGQLQANPALYQLNLSSPRDGHSF